MSKVGKSRLQLLAAAAGLALPVVSFAQTSASWIATGSGTWSVAANWSPATPPDGGGAATFGTSITAPANVTLTAPVTIGTLTINNPTNAYNITGSSSLTLGVGSAADVQVTVVGGHTISAPISTPANAFVFKGGTGTLTLSGNNAFGAGSGLEVDGGVVRATSAAALNGLAIVATANNGALELVNTGAVSGFFGLGSPIAPNGQIRSISGNNTWNGSWFVVQAGVVGVDTGTLTLNGDINDSGLSTVNGLTKVGAGFFAAQNIRLNGNLSVNAGTVAIQVNGTNSGTSRVNNLTIAGGTAPTARLDLNDNDLVINTGSLTSVTAQVKAALENGGNFDWLGMGIGSTRANALNTTAGSFLYGLGVIKNDLSQVGGSGPIYTDFSGQTLTGNEILVKFTYFGDADLSGTIDATDYSLIDNGYVNSLSGWINGDFDYSGSIDATDYALIDNAYVNQSGPLASAVIAEHTERYGEAYTAALRAIQAGAVPEPTAIGLLGAGALVCTRRRRRGS
ncbi:PEP-CTERM sorting domain-containing protein [Fontivita pretiosa]|uniref:PEP-CTERM sorting domain-containing protein n=1 Tax=Fontivita pretiosa TaxID=2989684 RepID=UPI003D16DFD8